MKILGKFQNRWKGKLKRLFGSENVEAILRDTLAFNVLKELRLEHKDEVLLSFFPKPYNKIEISNNIDRIRDYLKLVQPVEIAGLRRFGGSNDGGYIMATPPPFSEVAPTAISLGVSPYSPWDLEMANLGYKVVQYDASIPKAPYNHPNITFIKKFVGAKSEGDFISFEHVISSNAINKNAHNILQCDIEDFEWEILESIDLAMVADYFSQVLFEFHNCDPNNLELTNRRLKVLESLREYYSPIHLHFNNFGKGYYSEGLFWCETIEVSYMRNDLIPKDSKLKYGPIKLMGVDAANAEGYPDIPIIFKKP